MSTTTTPVERLELQPADPEPGDLASVRTVLEWALYTYSSRIACVSAFGPGSAVIFEAMAELGVSVPVVFIDTLYHFPETLQHVELVTARYHLDLRVYRAAATRAAFEAQHGSRLWEVDLDAYQRLTKLDPFRQASGDFAALLTGRRRDQAETRARLQLVDPGSPARINPLVAWTRADIWRFIHERNLPYNPLHDRGYASIGDAPLTTPIHPGEEERAGRWRGSDRLECGIHFVPVAKETT